MRHSEAFPLVFGPGNGGHGWTHSGTVNLTYGSFVVGALMSVNMVTMHNIRICSFTHAKLPHSGFALQPLQERFYHRRIAANGGKSDPEARWGSSLYGVFLIPMGLFIAAWTSFPNIVWIAPIIGFTLFGIGFYMIITAILNYVCGFLNLDPLS